MNPMKDALKAKRSHSMGSGMLGADAPVDHGSGSGPDASAGGDMHALVQSLSPDQKQQLMQALSKDSSGDVSKIEKGGPSDQERQKISENMSKDDEMDDDGGAPDYDSDEIALSMLDSKDKGPNASQAQPRNLGDRVKQGLASKLKAKGKL